MRAQPPLLCAALITEGVAGADSTLHLFNITLMPLIFVLEPPAELFEVRGVPYSCQYFGTMYSFETEITEFYASNPQYAARSIPEADFVVVKHCATYLFHLIKSGWNQPVVEGASTAAEIHDRALAAADENLLGIVDWAQRHVDAAVAQWRPAATQIGTTQRTHGHSSYASAGIKPGLVLALSLDKGRADYPRTSAAARAWHVVSTVGNPGWLAAHPYVYGLQRSAGLTPDGDACADDHAMAERPIEHSETDVTIPVPTGAMWNEASAKGAEARPYLMAYIGTSNSCVRREIVNLFGATADPRILVSDRPVEREQWRTLMERSRFCLVPDGYSSTSARLYEVILRGCVPIVISEAFCPPLERFVHLAAFTPVVHRSFVKHLARMLNGIDASTYAKLKATLDSQHKPLTSENHQFWAALFHSLRDARVRELEQRGVLPRGSYRRTADIAVWFDWEERALKVGAG